MSVVYAYAVVLEKPRGALGRGLSGEPLKLVAAKGLWVAAGRMKTAPDVEARTLKAHDAVVRRLAKASRALLPMRFGSVFEDDLELASRLRPRHDELVTALDRVAGCEQMTLRLYGTPVTARPKRTPAKGGVGARYLAARRAAHDAERELPEVAPLRTALARLVRGEIVERHAAPPLYATLYHLIARGDSASYEAMTLEVAPRLSVRVAVSGPWPPYAFAAEATP